MCESNRFGHFCGYKAKTFTVCHYRTGLSLLSMQGSDLATVTTSYDKQVGTHWRQCYIVTSKEYLTNSHILSRHFELMFLQLHLVKIASKLIAIRLGYERRKRVPFL